MVNKAVFAFVFLMSHWVFSSHAQNVRTPKREIRAVWITTTSGLDWPRSTNPQVQQSSLRQMLDGLQSARFNTIFFQVRARGDTYYKSKYEPWAENLTGTLGGDPGWDPLAFLLNEAHKRGIEVHAWFNLFKVRGPIPVKASSPEHPTRAFPSWTIEADGELWIDPGIPDARRYLHNVAMDLIRNYEVDGINFDFIRYPGKAFPDDRTYARYGNGMDREEWRRQNINGFVRDFYKAAMAIRPMLKVGSSPLGVYRNGSNGTKNGSYNTYYQDSFGWIQNGVHDYLAPQVYWTMGTTGTAPDFSVVLHQWRALNSPRPIIAGIAAYRPEILRDLGAYIDMARVCGMNGQAFFRYDNLGSFAQLRERYRTPANIPPMPWKDPVPPLPPTELTVVERSQGGFALNWTAPDPAGDGDTARYYNIYRSTKPEITFEDPSSILAITPNAVTSYTDVITTPSAAHYYYAVSAFDKSHNEGKPTPVASVPLRKVQELASKIPANDALALSLTTDEGRPTLAAYSLHKSTNVRLDLLRQISRDSTSMMTSIVIADQDQGSYLVSLGRLMLDPGSYVVRLVTEESRVEQSFVYRKQ
jgi:uncharacterized lipoprotein YddW (UPF0748 family)